MARPEKRRQAPIAQDEISAEATCVRCGGTVPHYGACVPCSYRSGSWTGAPTPSEHPPLAPAVQPT